MFVLSQPSFGTTDTTVVSVFVATRLDLFVVLEVTHDIMGPLPIDGAEFRAGLCKKRSKIDVFSVLKNHCFSTGIMGSIPA